MDFEKLFLQYMEEIDSKNQMASLRSIFRHLLKNFKKIFKTTKEMRSDAIKNEKALRMDGYLIENDLTNNEMPYEILESRGIQQPIWYHWYIMAYAEKWTVAEEYIILFRALQNITIESYKKNKQLEKENLNIIESLLEIGWDTLESDLQSFFSYTTAYERALNGDSVPSVRHIYTIHDLKKFYIKTLCLYEQLNYEAFQRVLYRNC